jgi:DNA polymerase-3 subunit epsilon
MSGPRQPGSARKAFNRLLVFIGLLLLIAGIIMAVQAVDLSAGFNLPLAALLGLLIGGIGAIWAGFAMVDHHFDELERLRGLLLVAAGRDEPLPPDWPVLGEPGLEALDLGAAARQAILAHRGLGGRTDDKLAAVVAAAAEGLLVMTEAGLVSLVNAAALKVLGAQAVAVGTSVYAALERDHMVEIEHRALQTGEAIEAELLLVDGRRMKALVVPLGEHGGFVISLPHREPGRRDQVLHDLTLHDSPPAVGIDADVPPHDWRLDELPILVFDSETTGLDVAIARVISLGAVRTHGHRLYPRINLDSLVDPGIPIPRPSIAIHGIADTMVAGAPDFAASWPRLAEMIEGTVVVGHSIGFDLAILKAECDRQGLAWLTPPALDTALLYSALYPKEKDIGLESLAARFGVEIEGRHTALGDALVTAEVWVALMTQLIDRGIDTYGAAREFSMNARVLLAQQRQAGWLPAARNENKGDSNG